MSDDVSADKDDETTAPEPKAPFLRVVRGDAAPEEIAALVAVLGSLQGPAPAAPRRQPAWSAPGRTHRRALAHGRGGWRSSGHPT